MKRTIGFFMALVIFLLSFGLVFADEESTIRHYSERLKDFGVQEPALSAKAEKDVEALIDSMVSDQYDVQTAYDNIHTQVNSLAKTSTKKGAAQSALDTAKERADDFTGLDVEEHLKVEDAKFGAPPYVRPRDNFTSSRDRANQAISEVRRSLIAPDRPGAVQGDPSRGVPTGDIVSDFIPQLIRQLFRFASIALLLAFTVSGVLLITAHGNDEKLTKAKSMIYYSFVGFAFISLAFAIIKAVTDIDFFRFI